MKVLIVLAISVFALGLGIGWLSGTSYAYESQELVRGQNGNWCLP